MASPALQRRPSPVPEDRDAAVLVDVVVLSSDMVLFDAIKAAIGERNPVWRARSAEESVDLLLTGRCGVLLMDLAAVSTRPATLVQQIAEQFPDVVVVVAGRREDEALLAQLISEGLVYRFMHKPLTAKRAGMFLSAATRCHVERRESRTSQPLLPLSSVLPTRADPRKWLFVAGGLAIFLGLGWLLAGGPSRNAHTVSPETGSRTPTPAVVADTARADPVLARARAALAAGRYEAPAGNNALDLYAAVLLAQPSQAEARAGLDKTVAHLVTAAERAAGTGDRTEAERLLKRIRAADPSSAAADHLAAMLAPHAPPAAAPAAVTANAEASRATAAPAAAPTGQAPVAKVTVRPAVAPDPLSPHYSNAADLHATSRHGAGRVRSYGAPISTGLPIAGYVKNAAPEPAPAPATAPATDAGAVAALALPADANDRIFATDPVYPPAALVNRIEGWVELMFTITETGAVRDIEVVDAQPRGVFESAATQALGNWRFRPRLANGQPVPRRSVVTLRFNVDG
ncbi:MAG: TonB family protein [Gammaproteobacteria bacterium]|nr:TonB family protein [Gammaproteobacteria bacterium]